MTRNGERAKRSQVPTVLQGKQAERYDDKQYGLLMDMPAEEKRGVSAERNSGNEVVPCGVEEELQQSRLLKISGIQQRMCKLLTIMAASVKTKVIRGGIFGNTANAESPTSPRVTLLTASASTGSFR